MESGYDERGSEIGTRFPLISDMATSEKKAYFLSDMHLGAAYREDAREREMKVVRFLDSIRDSAAEIFLLGDVLDYWFEYKYVVPKGFVRFFGKLAELADSGIKITWLIGNHDIWIFDYIPNELGIRVVDGVLDERVFGTRIVMEHGDGVWQRDLKFKILRKIFRNKVCQKLFSGIHPRWTIPFANGWSGQSRNSGSPKVEARQRALEESRRNKESWLPENIEALKKWCENYSIMNPDVRYYLFGHLHQVVREKIGENAEMLVIGDWLTHFTYAEFDGEHLQLKKFEL